jgi:hypothetical protein
VDIALISDVSLGCGAEGRVGGRRKKLDVAKRREIFKSVITGRKSEAEWPLYKVSQRHQSFRASGLTC